MSKNILKIISEKAKIFFKLKGFKDFKDDIDLNKIVDEENVQNNINNCKINLNKKINKNSDYLFKNFVREDIYCTLSDLEKEKLLYNLTTSYLSNNRKMF